MIQEILNILRCPVCVRSKGGSLNVYRKNWLICQDCERKYPIVEDIPILLIEEGDKWKKCADNNLPVPSPRILES